MKLSEYIETRPELRDMEVPDSGIKTPYNYVVSVMIERGWNKHYNQSAKCQCGHEYNRHFDSYEEMDAIGCKYCICDEFKPQ